MSNVKNKTEFVLTSLSFNTNWRKLQHKGKESQQACRIVKFIINDYSLFIVDKIIEIFNRS